MREALAKDVYKLTEKLALNVVFSIRPGDEDDFDHFLNSLKTEGASSITGFEVKEVFQKLSSVQLEQELKTIFTEAMSFALRTMELEYEARLKAMLERTDNGFDRRPQ